MPKQPWPLGDSYAKAVAELSMMRKSGNRFSDKIMLESSRFGPGD
jgi:hypothetical protein